MDNKVSILRLLAAISYDALLLIALLLFLHTITAFININQYILFWLITLPTSYFYFVYSWVKGKQTIGMKSWHIKIVNANYKTASIRFIAALISWLFFGLGYFYMLFNKKKLTLHDKMSSTFLIKTNLI